MIGIMIFIAGLFFALTLSTSPKKASVKSSSSVIDKNLKKANAKKKLKYNRFPWRHMKKKGSGKIPDPAGITSPFNNGDIHDYYRDPNREYIRGKSIREYFK